MARPVIYVLAGVNGAGKSSIGGHLLTEGGITWFNPDTFARELVHEFRFDQVDANIAAWNEGVRRLDRAIDMGKSYAFETTLGGSTIVRKLIAASASHDILVWYCALRDAQQHVDRVRFRVTQGGHDIPESKIRERCRTSVENMLLLMPHVAQVKAFDNSLEAKPGESVPDPRLVLCVDAGRCTFPTEAHDLHNTPQWAKPLVELAMSSLDWPFQATRL